MNERQALDLLGGLPAPGIREVWDAAEPCKGTELQPGIWLGRNGGMPWLAKRFVRHVVRRDWFAKLIADGWGINVRVRQDGTHTPVGSKHVAGGVKVDLPFRLTAEGLDYGYHVLGRDVGPAGVGLQMRDYLRAIGLRRLGEVVDGAHLRRVRAIRGEGDDRVRMVIGYIAPMGIRAWMGTPFGMIRDREATAAELRSAESHLGRFRLWDSSPGRDR